MKRFSGFLIVGTILFSACKSNETTPTESISLGLHQSGRLGSEVVVRVDSIQDGRCPMDLNCIWAGQAKVKLLLSKGTDSKFARLLLGPDGSNKRPDSTTVSLKNERYKVILREINPYPSLANQGKPQTAVVQVTKI
ncbi:hypothetical protein [Spirosoma fluviale]|nr:hypothetical protein [Spirosoma fluviale]